LEKLFESLKNPSRPLLENLVRTNLVNETPNELELTSEETHRFPKLNFFNMMETHLGELLGIDQALFKPLYISKP
jgi:hypothetical protein